MVELLATVLAPSAAVIVARLPECAQALVVSAAGTLEVEEEESAALVLLQQGLRGGEAQMHPQ